MSGWLKRYPGGHTERFWSKVNKDGPTVRPELGNCWLWTGTTTGKSHGEYGTFWDGTEMVLAHRFSLQESIGRVLAEGMKSCHHCDVPLCIRPEHLYEGTQGRNLQDAYDRKRRDTEGLSERLLAGRFAKLGY